MTDFDLVIVDEAHRGYILDRELAEEIAADINPECAGKMLIFAVDDKYAD